MVPLVHLDRPAPPPPANHWISTLIKNSEIHFSNYTLGQSTKPPRQSLCAQLLYPIFQWQAFLHVGRKCKTLLSNTHTHTCVCVCVCSWKQVFACTHMCAHANKHATHTCVSVCTPDACVCVCVCVCMCECVCTHACKCLHMCKMCVHAQTSLCTSC